MLKCNALKKIDDLLLEKNNLHKIKNKNEILLDISKEKKNLLNKRSPIKATKLISMEDCLTKKNFFNKQYFVKKESSLKNNKENSKNNNFNKRNSSMFNIFIQNLKSKLIYFFRDAKSKKRNEIKNKVKLLNEIVKNLKSIMK